jgi:hypothetical protein
MTPQMHQIPSIPFNTDAVPSLISRQNQLVPTSPMEANPNSPLVHHGPSFTANDNSTLMSPQMHHVPTVPYESNTYFPFMTSHDHLPPTAPIPPSPFMHEATSFAGDVNSPLMPPPSHQTQTTANDANTHSSYFSPPNHHIPSIPSKDKYPTSPRMPPQKQKQDRVSTTPFFSEVPTPHHHPTTPSSRTHDATSDHESHDHTDQMKHNRHVESRYPDQRRTSARGVVPVAPLRTMTRESEQYSPMRERHPILSPLSSGRASIQSPPWSPTHVHKHDPTTLHEDNDGYTPDMANDAATGRLTIEDEVHAMRYLLFGK